MTTPISSVLEQPSGSGVTTTATVDPGDAVEVYVAATGNDAADGTSWSRAKATVQGALAAIPATGGVVRIGPGTFAPFIVDSTSGYRRGISIIGAGPWATEIKATAAGVDAIKFISSSGTSIAHIRIEDLAVTGSKSGTVTGHGINFGGSDWWQIGQCHLANLRVESNGGSGIYAHDVNEMTFVNVRNRSNGRYSYEFSSDPADPPGAPVQTGNTWIFQNCNAYGNDLGGVLFQHVGNSITWIGGEIAYNISGAGDGVAIVPGASTRGINFIGAHFEGNIRGAHLGSNNAGGYSLSNITFTGCHFTGHTGGADVYLDGTTNARFIDCTLLGTTAGITVSNTAANSYTMHGCVNNGTNPVLRDRYSATYAKATDFRWGGRNRIINDGTGFADNVHPAIDYIKNIIAGVPWRAMADNTAAVENHMGAGSPEGVITAPPGSMYQIRSGGAGTTLYIKESGTGNTGWVAK